MSEIISILDDLNNHRGVGDKPVVIKGKAFIREKHTLREMEGQYPKELLAHKLPLMIEAIKLVRPYLDPQLMKDELGELAKFLETIPLEYTSFFTLNFTNEDAENISRLGVSYLHYDSEPQIDSGWKIFNLREVDAFDRTVTNTFNIFHRGSIVTIKIYPDLRGDPGEGLNHDSQINYEHRLPEDQNTAKVTVDFTEFNTINLPSIDAVESVRVTKVGYDFTQKRVDGWEL